MMDLSKITNKQVKNAIEALQSGDTKLYSYFTENPEMTDDGHRIEFKSFFAKALGNEKFLSIDKVEDDGKTLYGNFKAGQWGTFRVFFKFHQNANGKFERLDIGQAN
ncbi:SnoaL-like domain-containing protein [Elizabethkingia bruuniana]